MSGVANRPTEITRLSASGSRSATAASRFRTDFLDGMAARPRTIPCKYLYDDRGSELFEQICDLPEYYPTRSEIEVLRAHRVEIAAMLGRKVLLIEPGAGSGIKTRLVLSALEDPVGVAPIEISASALRQAAAELARRFPDLTIRPTQGDFTDDMEVPPLDDQERRVVYFPGSTIGNFAPSERRDLLRRFRALAGDDGAALIGVDLKKDPETLIAAYDDRQGVTAAFNLNLLRRANRELGTDFNPRGFEHRAVWNSSLSRIEMWLVSTREQHVYMDGHSWAFGEGEGIHTESSHKFTIAGFTREADAAGFDARAWWTDPAGRFAVLLFDAAPIVGME